MHLKLANRRLSTTTNITPSPSPASFLSLFWYSSCFACSQLSVDLTETTRESDRADYSEKETASEKKTQEDWGQNFSIFHLSSKVILFYHFAFTLFLLFVACLQMREQKKFTTLKTADCETAFHYFLSAKQRY